MKSLSHVRLFATPWTVAYQAPPSMGFSRQEYWSGLPFPPPGDLPNPGIEPGSPTLQADALPSEPPGKLHYIVNPMIRSHDVLNSPFLNLHIHFITHIHPVEMILELRASSSIPGHYLIHSCRWSVHKATELIIPSKW